MENHGLGTHNGKMCTESSTANAPNMPQFIWPICPNRPIICNIFENMYPLSMSIVHDCKHCKPRATGFSPNLARTTSISVLLWGLIGRAFLYPLYLSGEPWMLPLSSHTRQKKLRRLDAFGFYRVVEMYEKMSFKPSYHIILIRNYIGWRYTATKYS